MENKKIYLKEEKIKLTSNNPTHIINLNNNSNNTLLIPNNYDITSMCLSFPDELKEVYIIIGNQSVAFFDKELEKELQEFPIYLSLCKNMIVYLKLVYYENFIKEKEEFIYEDEYKEIEIYGEEQEFFDGNEYYWGSPVLRKNEPTGNKIRKVINGVIVNIPEIIFIIEKRKKYEIIETPVYQKISLQNTDNTYMELLKTKYNLKIRNGYGIVTNSLRYISNLAGLKYSF